MRFATKVLFSIIFLLMLGVSVGTIAFAAPKAELWPHWQANDPQSSTRIDHSAWAQFLDKYLMVRKSGYANLVRYAAVSSADKDNLAKYIDTLVAVPITKLSRVEQKTAWINLYNALTVLTILDHYPVKSIQDIRSGWFSSGPWDLKLIKVEGIELSLNDIEHRILRPIWQDNRVHYAVNCASLGCPNLQPEPFTAENSNRLLDKAAHEYVNGLRGIDLTGGELTLSSIYDWFKADFGGTDATLFIHLEQYATPALAAKLRGYRGTISYGYSWNLNKG